MNTHSIRFRLTIWYAGLLAGLLLLFGGSTWFGLAHYLNRSLGESVGKQARQIGENFLLDVQTSGESYVIEEINEHYSPERNDHLVRVTRADGSTLYVSGTPISKGFDPSQVSTAPISSERAATREERLSSGGKLLIYSLPFKARDGSRFMIETGAPNEPIEDTLRGLLLTLAIGLPVVIAIAMMGGYWIMRRALLPLDEIALGAERITSRSLNERLPVAHSGDEIERLSLALDRMIARLDESFQYIGRFTADASHELRTPLTVLRGELEAIAQRPRLDGGLRETVGSSLEETERLTRIVESLLTISRLDAGEAQMERVRFDLAELAATTTEQMRLLAEDKRIMLECRTNGHVEIIGDRARLKQVIVNLVDNAIKYTPKLIRSHHENNYTGAVRALNAVEQRLAAMLNDKDLPAYVYGDLKREELVRTGSVALHEIYFAGLGGDGKAGGKALDLIKQFWGGYEQWKLEFEKTANALAGGSGWVIFAYNLHTGQAHNYWAWDHMHNAPMSRPLLALDMYVHSYHMDYGAAAAKYVEAFMLNVNWEEVSRRAEAALKANLA